MGERTSRRPLGLYGEVDASQVEVLLRHPEVGVPGSLHHGEARVTGSGIVRDRSAAAVVEGPNVVRDPRLHERRPEGLGVPLAVER